MIIRSFYFRVTLLFYVYNAMLLNFLGGDGVKGNIGSLTVSYTHLTLPTKA